jgi:hypothetical protein
MPAALPTMRAATFDGAGVLPGRAGRSAPGAAGAGSEVAEVVGAGVVLTGRAAQPARAQANPAANKTRFNRVQPPQPSNDL